ncbi:Sulfite efflux pump SSU1, partial [Leucoagaricus sp. SymC.cos]
GTGSISILFFAFPYGQGTRLMAILSLAFNFLNIALFILFNACTIARFTVDPGSLRDLLKHPNYSLFFGCYPMGATTILNVSVNVVYQYYGFGGKRFVYFLWALWWINITISALCFWGGTHLMITRHSHSLSTMTAAWILPVVTFVVASSTGAVTADAVRVFSEHSALITLVVSAFLLTSGLLLASMMLAVYVLRLVVYGFPPGLSILSVFLPLGVSAQAGYSASLIGAELRSLLPLTSSQSPFFSMRLSGDAIHIFCSITAFLLWSWAVLWITYALLGLVHILRRTRIQFKLTAWGLVFPNGVFANLTIRLAEVFDSGFFRVVGAIYSILTFLLWCYVSYNTILMLPTLFQSQPVESGAYENEKVEKGPPTSVHSRPSAISTAPSIDTAYASQSIGLENTLIG